MVGLKTSIGRAIEFEFTWQAKTRESGKRLP